MANLRHATRKKQTHQAFAAQLFTSLQKLSRLQTLALGIAACMLTLGLAQAFSGDDTSSTTLSAQAINKSATASLVTAPSSMQTAVENEQPSTNKRKVITLTLNQPSTEKMAANSTAAHNSVSTLKTNKQKNGTHSKTLRTKTSAVTNTKPLASKRKVTHRIKSGDNLSEIFSSVGLSQRDVYNITSSGKQGKALTKMFPGESLTFVFKPKNTLAKIIREKSKLESIHFTPNTSDASRYESKVLTRTASIKRVHKNGTVTHSLSRAAEKSGLPQSTIMNMANIFGGVMDFALDVRGGDSFTIIYEEHYLDGTKIKDGNIIAAQYINRGTSHNAYRYEHSDGRIGYYNEEGVSLRRAFLRAPLDFTRVSSSFNLKRLHPITKKVKPHRGIDYAAARGTPVFSVGEGRVTASGYSKANGKYIFIKHGEAYTTKYLHLHKRSVKRGQRVKQGQIIGQVGCTGMCTGPHLHYEFLWNGVHRNPRTIVKKLPKAKRLAKHQLSAFTLATADTQDVLRFHSAQFEIASNQ